MKNESFYITVEYYNDNPVVVYKNHENEKYNRVIMSFAKNQTVEALQLKNWFERVFIDGKIQTKKELKQWLND